MTASVEASGFRDLDRVLRRLAGGLPDARLRDALREGGQLIADEAQRLAPVDTGLLRDSIQVTDDLDARLYGKVNGGGFSVYVGPVGSTEDGDVFYARFIEFGTVLRPAEPFMRPAIAAKRPEAEALVLSRLRADLTELAK